MMMLASCFAGGHSLAHACQRFRSLWWLRGRLQTGALQPPFLYLPWRQGTSGSMHIRHAVHASFMHGWHAAIILMTPMLLPSAVPLVACCTGLSLGCLSLQIWLEDSVRGFYRGCVTNLVRTTPAAAVTFTSFELISNRLRALAEGSRCGLAPCSGLKPRQRYGV